MVRRGDTLYSLAQRLGTDVNTLAQANGLRPADRLRAGQKLRVGGLGSLADASPALGTGGHFRRPAHRHGTSDGARRMTYVVRRGDTLYGIARLLQVTVNELMGWNGCRVERSLHPGPDAGRVRQERAADGAEHAWGFLPASAP